MTGLDALRVVYAGDSQDVVTQVLANLDSAVARGGYFGDQVLPGSGGCGGDRSGPAEGQCEGAVSASGFCQDYARAAELGWGVGRAVQARGPGWLRFGENGRTGCMHYEKHAVCSFKNAGGLENAVGKLCCLVLSRLVGLGSCYESPWVGSPSSESWAWRMCVVGDNAYRKQID